MRNKYSPAILQTLGGAPQRDIQYDQKFQEFQEAKEHMLSLKKVIDNFPKKLEGYKNVLDTISATSEFIFKKNNKDSYQFMHNISSAHHALSEKLSLLFSQFTQIKNNSNIWIKELNDVITKCSAREEYRKKYEHYEKKLYELNEDRVREIRKKNKVSESDHERFIRNIGKFQKNAKEYIFLSNSAYKSMEQFMNNRFDRIIMTMVSLIEAERNFYNEANHIMNFFANIRNNSFNLKKSFRLIHTNYDASVYLKGRTILTMSVEEIFSNNFKIMPIPQNQGQSQEQGQDNNFGNSNNNSNKIINPFTAESDEQNNNNMSNNNMNNNNIPGNNFGNNNTNCNTYNKAGFGNKSTRETYAMSNPYNSQANNQFPGNQNNFGNNNFVPKDSYNPFGNNNNNEFNNPYSGGNNNFNNKDKDDPWGLNSKNNNNFNNNQGQNNNNKKNNNQDDDPFNF
jgi:hypothetical protein